MGGEALDTLSLCFIFVSPSLSLPLSLSLSLSLSHSTSLPFPLSLRYGDTLDASAAMLVDPSWYKQQVEQAKALAHEVQIF